MAPTVISGSYAKDLSKSPSLSGGFFHSRTHEFIVPDDTIIYRIVETTYDKADYHHVAEVYELAFHSPDFIEDQIDTLRDDGASDDEVVKEIMALGMEDDQNSVIVARFAYDNFDFLDQNQRPASGKQIRGAFVDPQKAGAGLAGQIYRQFVLIYGHLVCDNTQTEYGAALWAGTIRDVVGRVDIYDTGAQKYIEELDDLATGAKGFIPWDLSTATYPHVFQMSRWKNYPFQIKSCRHIVLIVSR
ncbi:hypothetical protein Q9R34_19175 [Enterobacter sp. BRE11]|nr:hypothetical protein [Enterobacter sp. BRE11]